MVLSAAFRLPDCCCFHRSKQSQRLKASPSLLLRSAGSVLLVARQTQGSERHASAVTGPTPLPLPVRRQKERWVKVCLDSRVGSWLCKCTGHSKVLSLYLQMYVCAFASCRTFSSVPQMRSWHWQFRRCIPAWIQLSEKLACQ